MSRLLSVAGAALLAACASVPTAEFAAYSEGFARAHAAGDLILDALVPETAPAAGDCAPDPATGARPCFSVAQALGEDAARQADPPDIAVRRAALAIVAGYNRLVADLAEGRSSEALGMRIDRLAGIARVAAALAPGATLPTEAFAALAVRFEAMRTADAAATSVLAAEADVRAMIDLLIADAPVLYELVAVEATGDLGQASIDLRRAELTGDTAAEARLRARVAALSDPDGNAARLRRFEAALTAYVRLLDQSGRALDALVAALEAGRRDRLTATAELARRSTETRMLAERLTTETRALRAAAR